MDKFLYAIYEISPNDITILTQDGGIATIHKVEDGENEWGRYISTYYQDRCDATFGEEMWDRLWDSKVYFKDWSNKTDIDQQMIDDALEWLNVFCHDFEQVDFNFLTNQITRQ